MTAPSCSHLHRRRPNKDSLETCWLQTIEDNGDIMHCEWTRLGYFYGCNQSERQDRSSTLIGLQLPGIACSRQLYNWLAPPWLDRSSTQRRKAISKGTGQNGIPNRVGIGKPTKNNVRAVLEMTGRSAKKYISYHNSLPNGYYCGCHKS